MGMPKIEFRLQMFRGDWDQIWSQMRLLWLMEGLCRVNQTHIRQMNAFKERGLMSKVYPSVYRSGLHYETEKGTEIWPDIPSLLTGTMGKGLFPGNWGDCLPVSTLVLKDDYSTAPIGSLVPGDRIMGDGALTTVVEHAITGEKPILAFELNNGCVFRCSPEHRLFLADNTEIRAEDVKPSMLLRTPTAPFPEQAGISHGNMSQEDFAWLIGVFVADGWCELPRHPRFSISGKDGFKKEEQKRKVLALAERAGLDTRWTERYITINDRELAQYMQTCGHLAPNKHLPSLALTYPQVRAALEGLKADASLSSSGTFTHGTTSETLALQTRILYRMLGQSVHIKRWDEHGGLGKNPIYRVTARKSDAEVGNHQSSLRNSARVVAIREEEAELCADITTDTGRFYLPESDLIVHNCEDLACYRVAEYRELPWHYQRPFPGDKKKTEYADPAFPQGPAEQAAAKANKPWPGWKRVKGGIKSKPFAKWRRGPGGNYHYHALTMMPDGRLEDPSLVLGMGKEGQFAEEGMAEKLRTGAAPVIIQYAKKPDVMVVDPEKPSGYAGGKGSKLDAQVVAMLKKGEAPAGVDAALNGDPEMGAYLSNEIPLGEGEFDVDALIGWNRSEGRFEPKTDRSELNRLLGYAKH